MARDLLFSLLVILAACPILRCLCEGWDRPFVPCHSEPVRGFANGVRNLLFVFVAQSFASSAKSAAFHLPLELLILGNTLRDFEHPALASLFISASRTLVYIVLPVHSKGFLRGRSSKMRKSLFIIPALFMVAALVAPCARADSVTFTCVATEFVPCTVAAPTAPNVTFSSSGTTLDITWDSQKFDITLPSGWLATDSFTWFASNNLFIISNTSLGVSPPVEASINTNSPDVNDESGALTFTPGTVSTTPEPGTITLMLLGIGLVWLVMRKRIARGLLQAS